MKIVENHIIQESDEKRYHMCDDIVTDISDTIFDPESETLIGDIFRASQKEHGRCVSKVYVDAPEDSRPARLRQPIAIGWVFQKRERYEDSKETFIHETWVSLYDEWHSVPVRKPHAIA